MFKSSYCKLDWRLFDPNELAWRFDADAYVEQLKAFRRRRDPRKGLEPVCP